MGVTGTPFSIFLKRVKVILSPRVLETLFWFTFARSAVQAMCSNMVRLRIACLSAVDRAGTANLY